MILKGFTNSGTSKYAGLSETMNPRVAHSETTARRDLLLSHVKLSLALNRRIDIFGSRDIIMKRKKMNPKAGFVYPLLYIVSEMLIERIQFFAAVEREGFFIE